jgi:hypothetical protein
VHQVIFPQHVLQPQYILRSLEESLLRWFQQVLRGCFAPFAFSTSTE